MMKNEKKAEKVLGRTPFEGETNFLNRLLVGMLAVIAVTWSYSFYFQFAVVTPATSALESTEQAIQKTAIDYLPKTHFFSNIVVPESFVSPQAVLLNGMRDADVLTAIGEQKARDAVQNIERATGETFENVMKTLNAKTAVDREKKAAFTAAAPEMAAWLALSSSQFDKSRLLKKDGTLTSAAGLCREFTPCLREYVEKTSPHLLVLSRIQQSRSGQKVEWSPAETRQAIQCPTAIIQGFGENPELPLSEDEIALISSVFEAQRGATRNGFVFSGFMTLATLMIAFTRLLSDRIRPKDYV